MNIPQLIKNKRLSLKESQNEFGKRFGVTHASVSDWETGKSEAGYKVIEFVLEGVSPQTKPVKKVSGIFVEELSKETNLVTLQTEDGCQYEFSAHVEGWAGFYKRNS